MGHRSDREIALQTQEVWRLAEREQDAFDLTQFLSNADDCDYTTRVPSGLERIGPPEIERIIAESDRPVVLKFGKAFCGWTKRLNRALQELVPRYRDRADFYEVNLPEHEELYDEWSIETSPMMILIQDGEEVDRSDAAEAWEVPPVFEAWFGPPAAEEGNGEA